MSNLDRFGNEIPARGQFVGHFVGERVDNLEATFIRSEDGVSTFLVSDEEFPSLSDKMICDENVPSELNLHETMMLSVTIKKLTVVNNQRISVVNRMAIV